MSDIPLVSVAIADDHRLVRDSIRNIISTFPGFQVTIAADNGKHLIELLNKAGHLPDICILDIQMPEMNGFDTMVYLRKKWPELKVLALSMLDDEFSIIRMLKSGARGYILKGDGLDELHKALESIYRKEYYSSELVASNFFRLLNKEKENAWQKISDREMEFLKYCCTELSIKEIASKMNISTSTAQGYRNGLFDKLNLKTRQGLTMFAIKTGIVSIDDL